MAGIMRADAASDQELFEPTRMDGRIPPVGVTTDPSLEL
jgi:hypothetical protein